MITQVQSQARRLRTREAAKYIGVSWKTLENARWRGTPAIPFIKVGKCVVYDTTALDEWLLKQRRTSTSKTPEAA